MLSLRREHTRLKRNSSKPVSDRKATLALVTSMASLAVSSFFAWKQTQLAEKTFAESQENLSLSMMPDFGAPVNLEPPRRFVQPAPTPMSAPELTTQWRVLVSNTSLTSVTIKRYELETIQQGWRQVTFKDHLYTNDGAELKSATSVEPGRSLRLYARVTTPITFEAYEILKAAPVHSLSEAGYVLALHHTDFFGQTPAVQVMPNGMEANTFFAKGYPSLRVSIETARGQPYSWLVPWNGNDIFE